MRLNRAGGMVCVRISAARCQWGNGGRKQSHIGLKKFDNHNKTTNLIFFPLATKTLDETTPTTTFALDHVVLRSTIELRIHFVVGAI